MPAQHNGLKAAFEAENARRLLNRWPLDEARRGEQAETIHQKSLNTKVKKRAKEGGAKQTSPPNHYCNGVLVGGGNVGLGAGVDSAGSMRKVWIVLSKSGR